MDKPIIYLSGSITNDPNYEDHFRQAEENLSAYYHVINPAKFYVKDMTYTEIIIFCFYMLELADEIHMLKGHEKSKGATMEYLLAQQNKIKMFWK